MCGGVDGNSVSSSPFTESGLLFWTQNLIHFFPVLALFLECDIYSKSYIHVTLLLKPFIAFLLPPVHLSAILAMAGIHHVSC